MRFRIPLTLFVPVACLLAQTPPPAAAPAPATPAADSKRVVLTIGDQKMTAEQFDALLDILPEQYRAQAKGPGKRAFAEQIVRLKILSDEAKKRGLDKDPRVVDQLNFQTQNVLAGALFQKVASEKSGDPAAVKKYFDDHRMDYDEIKARHILVRFQGSPVPIRENGKDLTDAEALKKIHEIQQKLAAGEKFEALAKTESDDTVSGAQGGDLGSFRHGQMVPAFEQAAFSLPERQLSAPVKTQFGYHLIWIDEHKTAKFEDVKADIERKIGPEYAGQVVEDMRKKAAVTLDDAFFPQAPPPVVPGTPAVSPAK